MIKRILTIIILLVPTNVFAFKGAFIVEDTLNLGNDSIIVNRITEDLKHTLLIVQETRAILWTNDTTAALSIDYLFITPGTVAIDDGTIGNGISASEITSLNVLTIPQLSYSNIAAEIWGLSDGPPTTFSGAGYYDLALTDTANGANVDIFGSRMEKDTMRFRLNNGSQLGGAYGNNTNLLDLVPVLKYHQSSEEGSALIPTTDDKAVMVYVESGGQTHTDISSNGYRAWFGYYSLQGYNAGIFWNARQHYNASFWRLQHRFICEAIGDTVSQGWFNEHECQGYEFRGSWTEGGTSGQGAIINTWIQVNSSKLALPWSSIGQPYGVHSYDSTVHPGWKDLELAYLWVDVNPNVPTDVDSSHVILRAGSPNVAGCTGENDPSLNDPNSVNPNVGAYDIAIGVYYVDTNFVMTHPPINLPPITPSEASNYMDEFYLQKTEHPAKMAATDGSRHWLSLLYPQVAGEGGFDTIRITASTNYFGRTDTILVRNTVADRIQTGEYNGLVMILDYQYVSNLIDCVEFRWMWDNNNTWVRNSDGLEQTRYVIYAGNPLPPQPPVTVVSIPDKIVLADALITFTFSAVFGTTPYVFSYESVDLPAGDHTINSSSGVFSWTPGTSDIGTYDVTFMVTDDISEFHSQQVQIRVVAPGTITKFRKN